MEDERTTMTNKHGKKKIHPLSSLSIGGEGGIAGLLVFGGALAIAGFMAVASLASNKHKTKGTHDHHPKPKHQQLFLDEHGCKSEEDHDTTQSLSSLLQHSTIPHGDATCCRTSNMSVNQVSSSEFLSAQPLILEEKTELKASSVEENPTRFHHQEIVFSDYSHPGSASSSNESGVAEECLVSLLNSSGQAQEVENDEEPQDDLTSSETETEDDDIKDDDEIGEEDSSKATGTTSLDYNEEPVWPAELIQEPKQKFKGDYCDSNVCSDSAADGSDYAGNDDAMTVAKETTLSQNVNFSMMPNNQPSALRTWLFPLLLLALLLLLVLLTRRSQESFYVLDDGNSVIVP